MRFVLTQVDALNRSVSLDSDDISLIRDSLVMKASKDVARLQVAYEHSEIRSIARNLVCVLRLLEFIDSLGL